jgi:predicted enzyme related to lactoylglutathione lyase
MEAKLTQFPLVVSNKVQSLAFFTEKVGFDKKTDVTNAGYRYVTVAPKEETVELVLWEVGSATDPAHAEISKQWLPGRSPPLMFRVSDCRKTYEELRARGVQFSMPPTETPWGILATFQDPDVNLFTLNQPAGRWSTS